MHTLRSILAVLFAILIANPACCCAAAEPVQVEHRCCQHTHPPEKDSPDQPRICSCDARAAGLSEDHRFFPSSPEFVLPPLFAAAGWQSAPPVPPAPLLAPPPVEDTGPPRLRLTLFQRFLI